MMEATLLLATIAQRFQFRAEPGHVVTPSPSFTLRPKHGVRMRLEKKTLQAEFSAFCACRDLR
jgi:cytochrome P450